MKVSVITPNQTNDEIYDKTDLSSLVNSIAENGLLEPIVVTKTGTIISGHRRFAAVKELGWEDIDVRVVEPDNETIALIEHNRYRSKTEKDILRESRFLEKELKKRIGSGRYATKNRGGQKLHMDLELARNLNVGVTKLKQLRSIENYQPQLIEDIAEKKISVSAAYKKVQTQFINKSNEKPKNKFPNELRKLLETHNPSYNEIKSIIRTTYPYSLEETGISELQRDELREHLKYLKSLDSQELMLVQKQDEITNAEFSKSRLNVAKKLLPTTAELDQFWSSIIQYRVKKDGVNPLDNIQIISPDDEIDGFTNELWTTLRTTISSFEYSSGPGRSQKYFVGFNLKNKFRLLGIVSFASDSQRLLVRDEHIGWDDQQRSRNREHLVNMNTCVATQPFGHNRLGMKFLCSLMPQLVTKWEHKYDTKIVGITTTSIHGQSSAYNGIKWWKQLGTSSGSQFIKPLRDEWSFWNGWLNENYADELDEVSGQSSPLQAKLKLLYRCLGFGDKDLKHEHKRGVLMCGLYDNWREFLRDEVKIKQLKPTKIDWQDWWVKKSRQRHETLAKKNELADDILFYENLDDLTDWLEVRGSISTTT